MMHEVEEPLLGGGNAPDRDSGDLEVSINHDPPPSPGRSMTPETCRRMTRRVTKNMCVLLLSSFMFFTGFMALSNLQSTMNSENGIGTESQAAIYISSMLSACLLPAFAIKNIGCKWTLVCAIFCSLPYIVSNVHPMLETLLPTAVLLGLSAGPLTAAQSLYVEEMAQRYHKIFKTGEFAVVAARFFGYNSFATSNTQIWGNLISYYVLRPDAAPATLMNGTNHTICGVHFTHDLNSTRSNIEPPSDEERHLLVAIFTALGAASVLMMAVFLDPLETDVERDATGSKWDVMITWLMSALRQSRKWQQGLLIPISVYCGLETSFYASDFTQAFIACSWGVHHVGFVTICFGVCGAIMSILVGPLVKCTSQIIVILMAAVINVITCIMLFLWEPTPDTPVIYFVFAGFWGMTDAIWWSQVAALYGLMFPNDREAAFSNFFFWSFLGYFLSYSYANYFPVATKIIIMLCFLVSGIVLYAIGQFLIKRSSSISVVQRPSSPRGGDYEVFG